MAPHAAAVLPWPGAPPSCTRAPGELHPAGGLSVASADRQMPTYLASLLQRPMEVHVSPCTGGRVRGQLHSLWPSIQTGHMLGTAHPTASKHIENKSPPPASLPHFLPLQAAPGRVGWRGRLPCRRSVLGGPQAQRTAGVRQGWRPGAGTTQVAVCLSCSENTRASGVLSLRASPQPWRTAAGSALEDGCGFSPGGRLRVACSGQSLRL